MDIILISLVAFLVSILTFFSGFGLGTILTPVFMVFFPVDLAIALTGVVHFFNNVFKLFLVGKHADRAVLLRFGIPAIIAAFLGSWILIQLSDLQVLATYQIGDRLFQVETFKLIVSILLIVFAVWDLVPGLANLEFGKEKLPIGGALSGFFGGLTGNQGALRSAFLIRAGLSKEAFIGTAVVVSSLVDFTRLGVYATRFANTGLSNHLELVFWATTSAIFGAFLGNKLLKKVTLTFLQKFIAVLLIILSLALGSGLL